MSINGIDISSYQTVAQAVNPNAGITIVKATEGNWYVNPRCDAQYQNAKKHGKLLGVYHYAEGKGAVAEADYFLKNIKGYIGQAVLILDWERGSNSAYGNGNYVKQFVDRVHSKTGVYPVLYTGSEGFAHCQQVKSVCAGWCAGYPYAKYASFKAPAMSIFNSLYNAHGFNLIGWQYSDYPVDHSIFWVTSAQWKLYANPKGAKKPAQVSKPKPTKKPVKKPSKKPTRASFRDKNGLKWYKESATFTLNRAINLRAYPTHNGKLLMTLAKGSSVKYDAYCYYDGYVWIRQPRGNGKYGYLATGQHRNLKRINTWGTFK